MIRRSFRLGLTVLLVVAGALVIRLAVAMDRLRGRPPLSGWGRRSQVGWCRLFCALYGVRVRASGPPLTAPPVLVAANHVSWLDIVVIASRWPVVFLSKSEVARWPLVGGVATGLGTMYIRRGATDAAREATTVMAERLNEGHAVVFFPEGTTTDGSGIRRLIPRLFEAARRAHAPVQPLALRYCREDGSRCPVVPFVGNEPLVANVWRLAAVPRLEARLTLTAPIESGDRDRAALARLTEQALRETLAGGDDAPVAEIGSRD